MRTLLLALVLVSAARAAHADCPVAAVPSAAPLVTPRQVFQDRLADGIDALAFSPDGVYLAATTGARSARVWHVAHHAAVSNLRRPGILPPWSVAWSPDPDRLVLGQTASILVDVAHDTDVGRFADPTGFPTAGMVRRIPGNATTPYVGTFNNDLALYDPKLQVAAKLAWPDQPSSAHPSGSDRSRVLELLLAPPRRIGHPMLVRTLKEVPREDRQRRESEMRLGEIMTRDVRTI